jgi:hypothetical protein
VFQICPFDSTAHVMQHHFMFRLSTKGSLDKLYMVPTSHTQPHGLRQQWRIVCAQYPVEMHHTANYTLFHRGITGHPKKYLQAIKEECMQYSTVLFPKMLYCLTFVESQMFESSTSVKQTFKICTSIHPAYSHGLFLENKNPESNELHYAGIVAESVYELLFHHWDNFPK